MQAPCDIRITTVGLKNRLLVELDPKTGEMLAVHEMTESPYVSVAHLGNIEVHPVFVNTCLAIQEALQRIPKQKLLGETND